MTSRARRAHVGQALLVGEQSVGGLREAGVVARL